MYACINKNDKYCLYLLVKPDWLFIFRFKHILDTIVMRGSRKEGVRRSGPPSSPARENQSLLIYLVKLLKIGLGPPPPYRKNGSAYEALYHIRIFTQQGWINPGFKLLMVKYPRVQTQHWECTQVTGRTKSLRSAKHTALLIAYLYILCKNKYK